MPQQLLMWDPEAPVRGASPWALAVREAFARRRAKPLHEARTNDITLSVYQDPGSAWVVARWHGREGGVAFRTAYCPDSVMRVTGAPKVDGAVEWRFHSTVGEQRVRLEVLDREASLVRFTVSLAPIHPLRMPFWPVDVYPLDEHGDPTGSRGVVFAAQRGPAAAILFMAVTSPPLGSFLYLQNATALNSYCEQLHVAPEGRVGGMWPELGYTPPLSEREPLVAAKETVISDAFVRFHPDTPVQPRQSAVMFLEMLAEMYPHLPRPETEYRDWPGRARQTVKDLAEVPGCTTVRDGRRFLNAYMDTGERRPESLVQLSLLLPLLEYQEWSGEQMALAEELRAGLPDFYDEQIGSVLRYRRAERQTRAQDVDEKDAWEVDSWYLYHPLANLGRLARGGDAAARELFLGSLEYAIRVAQHFDYRWPVLFRAETLEVAEPGQDPRVPGEADVPGLYAYAMLLAYDLTGEERYLAEAKLAAESFKALNFDIGYQFNNTAWGAIAMLRLYHLTRDETHLETSYVCLASVFHNMFLWECDYGLAKHYSTFLGLTPLRAGPYLATYEEQETFAAFHEYLETAGEEADPSLRMLLAEYCKYALYRIWHYYPSELPEVAVSKEPRNGHIEREAAIPLEDIYEGWQPAGQVGQQVYGAGAALAFVTRAYHRVKRAPFLIFCEYPLSEMEAPRGTATLKVHGDPRCDCLLRLVPQDGEQLPAVSLHVKGLRGRLQAQDMKGGHREFRVPGGSTVTVTWDA